MAIVPGWVSTTHGLYVFAAGFSGAVGVACVASWRLRRADRLPAAVGRSHFVALGRVLLVSVILWSYLAFATLLLVWITDLPAENRFYAERVAGGWAVVSGALLFGHFVIPFLALLSRRLKRRPAALAAVVGALDRGVLHALGRLLARRPVGPIGIASARARSTPARSSFAIVFGLACCAAGAWRYFAAAPYPVRDPAGLARAPSVLRVT